MALEGGEIKGKFCWDGVIDGDGPLGCHCGGDSGVG